MQTVADDIQQTMMQVQEMEPEKPAPLSHLSKRLLADFTAGCLASALVSPFLVLIDGATAEKATTRNTLRSTVARHGLAAVKHPVKFIRSTPFKIIFTLYAATYVTANASDSICKEFSHERMSSLVVFVSTFAVNVPIGVWKDVRFSQIFGRRGTGAVAPESTQHAIKSRFRVPGGATAAFLIRDAVTIFGSFTLPAWVSAAIPSRLVPDESSRDALSQLMVPALSQVPATPFHVVGMDLAARRDGATMREVVARQHGHMLSITSARCIRIVPALGVGLLANKDLRGTFQAKLEEAER